MKGIIKFFSIFFGVIAFLAPLYSYGGYENDTGVKKEWFLSKQLSRLDEQLADKVQGFVNSLTPEKIYSLIGKEIGEAFGKAFSDTFSGMISIGPFVSIDSIIGSFGKSESQVMTSVILKAIQEAKEEIIAAIEEQHRLDTRIRLDALIQNLDIYNSRSLSQKPGMLTDLILMSQEATVVRNRIALSPTFSLEDIHSYMLVASLQLSILRDIATWNAIASDPDIDDEEIDEEIRSTFSSVLHFVNLHISSSHVSTISYWREEFENEFSNVRFLRLASQSDLPSAMIADYAWAGSAVYAYTMAGRDVEFLVLRVKDSCDIIQDGDGGREVLIRYHVYNPKNVYLGDGHAYYGASNVSNEMLEEQGCAVFDGRIVTQIELGRFSFHKSQSVRDMRVVYREHLLSDEAFEMYLAEGYLPVKKMLDSWWEMNRDDNRPESEVDVYVTANIEVHPDLNLSFYEDEGDEDNYFLSFSNLGGGTASDAKIIVHEPPNVMPTKLYVFNDQTEDYEQHTACIHTPGMLFFPGRLECDFGHIQAGESISVMVEVSAVSGGWWVVPRRYDLVASVSNREIIKSDNKISFTYTP